MKRGEAIESKMLTRQIERAQRKVEAHNFDIRKQLLEYDDVANEQRKVVYQQRSELMEEEDIAEAIRTFAGGRQSRHRRVRARGQRRGDVGQGGFDERPLEREFGVHLDAAKLLEQDELASTRTGCAARS